MIEENSEKVGWSFKEMVNRKEKKTISNPFAICLTAFPKAQRVGEMTQEVRVLVTKPCYLSSNTQGGERELPISCPLMAT